MTTSTQAHTDAGLHASSSGAGSELTTSQGVTTIADTVVSKIAGMAARDVSGVYELGTGSGTAKAFSAIRDRIPGAGQATGQGVSVEVGETQAAIDLDLVVEFGVAIGDLAQAVRRNVISSVERMTGLEVTEVNITVNDIHLPSDDAEQQDEPARVQ
jgi:uncharacterized alkaline shock family protein YloU